VAKSSIYMASRTVKRLPRDTVKNAIEHFISTGSFTGSAELAVEVVTHALDRGWTVTLTIDGSCVLIKRSTPLKNLHEEVSVSRVP
jgi:hypothetical protein